MESAPGVVGARGVDSLPFSEGGVSEQAQRLRSTGIDFFVGYLGAVNVSRLAAILDAGLAFMPVTFADAFDGDSTVAQCDALSLPSGCTVWLDIEGKNIWTVNAQELMAEINGWADAIIAGGFMPGLYVGSPQPLTGDELYALRVVRYWKAASRIIDRNGRVWDGPACGFCMYQCWPSRNWPDDKDANRVLVDVDFMQEDLRGRLPTWVVA